MLMSDIIKDLQYGELSTHGMFAVLPITEDNKQQLIRHTNVALTELYSRFPLLTRELTIVQIEGKTTYKLSKEHTLSIIDKPSYTKYIVDSEEFPFMDDVVRILKVHDEIGNEIRINDSTARCVVTTPAPNVLQLPYAIDTNILYITYQAKHYEITKEEDKLILPSNFKPALLAYIGYRVYSGGSTQEHVNLSNMLLQKYELFCTQQRDYGTDNSYDFEKNIKPCLGGWV